jgi:uncharacterized protein
MAREIFDEIIEEKFFVESEEGVLLAVVMKRPRTDQALPVLMTYTPYRVSTGLGGVDLLDFAKYGYVTLIFDVRGTGDSSGVCDSVYSDGEQRDGAFMIDWAAKQSWSNGKVGIWGISYGAIISLQMAAKAPAALKAIIARSGSDDPFAEWTNLGGVPRNYIYESYAPFMSVRNFAPPSKELWGDEWKRIWQERLETNTPWGISFLNNIEDSKFWRARATRHLLDQITCPVFVVEGWSDWYSNPMLRIFSKLQGAKRALIGPWGHQWPDKALPGPRIDWQSEALAWWDRWLKDIDTGIDASAPLTLYVEKYRLPSNFIANSPGFFMTAASWPPEGSDPREYFFDLHHNSLTCDSNSVDQRSDEVHLSHSVMAGAYSGKVGGGPFRYNVLKPLDQRLESPHSFTLLAEPSKETQLIVGNPKAHLYLASDSEIGQVSVSLIDQAPDGAEYLISRGFLNLSYASYPKNTAQPLTPDSTYEVDIELVAVGYQLEAGHRLGVKISTADFQMSWPAAKPFTLSLFSSPAHSQEKLSSISIPFLESASDQGVTIKLLENDPAPELPDVAYKLTQDLTNQKVGYRFESKSVFGNSGQLTIDSAHPANAEISAKSIYEELNGPHQIRIEAECVTASDENEIWHEVEILALLDGEEYFRKRYQARQPRRTF